MGLFIAFIVLAIVFFKPRFKDEKVLSVYFGLPGAGKSTFAASLAHKCNKESLIIRYFRRHEGIDFCRQVVSNGKLGPFKLKVATPVYSNVPILGAYEIDSQKDIGFNHIEAGKLIIDEV